MYRRLLEMTCQMANVLKTQCDVKKGDRVIIYMPNSPVAVAAMLACARIWSSALVHKREIQLYMIDYV